MCMWGHLKSLEKMSPNKAATSGKEFRLASEDRTSHRKNHAGQLNFKNIS